MRTFDAIIVLADISGYTEFLVLNRSSLFHAEQIITELMETVTCSAAFPLQLHKLEGDAAFFYAETNGDTAAAANDVMRQVVHIMQSYQAQQRRLFERSVGGCMCSACQSIEKLTLKFVVETGEVLEKQVAGHTELAGAPVILAHRLMKNLVEADSYILMTKAASGLLEAPPYVATQSYSENVEHFGTIDTVAYFPAVQEMDRHGVKPLSRPSAIVEAIRLFGAGALHKISHRDQREFRNFPES